MTTLRFAISMMVTWSTFFATVTLASEGGKLSQHLLRQIMRYHSDSPDFEPFGYKRPSPAEGWVFSKRDFTQYLFNLQGMVSKVYEVADFYRRSGVFSEEQFARLMTMIEGETLGEAIALDLAQEHQVPAGFTLTAEARLYLNHLEKLKDKDDPIYLLFSVYSVVFGHAFGAKAFLRRAVTLGLAESPHSRAYPQALQTMRTELSNFIDEIAAQQVQSKGESYKKYSDYLLFEFVIQGSTLRVLDKSMRPLNTRLFLQKRREIENENPS